jgi:hypothetical protein
MDIPATIIAINDLTFVNLNAVPMITALVDNWRGGPSFTLHMGGNVDRVVTRSADPVAYEQIKRFLAKWMK